MKPNAAQIEVLRQVAEDNRKVSIFHPSFKALRRRGLVELVQSTAHEGLDVVITDAGRSALQES